MEQCKKCGTILGQTNFPDEAAYAEEEGMKAAQKDNWPRVVFWALRWASVRWSL